MTDERKAFEAWAISRAYSLNKNVVFGNYVDGNVEFAWQVWQARGTQQGPVAPMTYEQRQELVKECGLDWHRGFMPLFDGDPTNRYAVLIEAVAALNTSPPSQQEPVGAIVQDESRNPAHTPMVVWFNQIPAIGTNLFTSPPSQPDAVLAAVLKRLETRLEVSPDHPYDGIASRDETIKLLTTELAAAKKDATAARANLAWVANNIEGANYDRWTERAGIAEDAKAILRRQRKPDSDELQYLALYDAATGIQTPFTAVKGRSSTL